MKKTKHGRIVRAALFAGVGICCLPQLISQLSGQEVTSQAGQQPRRIFYRSEVGQPIQHKASRIPTTAPAQTGPVQSSVRLMGYQEDIGYPILPAYGESRPKQQTTAMVGTVRGKSISQFNVKLLEEYLNRARNDKSRSGDQIAQAGGPQTQQPAGDTLQAIRQIPPGQEDTARLLAAIGDVEIVALDALGIVIIRGNPQDVEAVEKIIEEVQKIAIQFEPKIEVFQLERASASQVRDTITELYGSQAGGAGDTNDNNQSSAQTSIVKQFQIALNDRANQLVVIASPPMIEELGGLIKRLDVDSAPIVNEVKRFPLKNAEATEVRDILLEAITGSATTGGGGGGQGQGGAAQPGQEAQSARRFNVLTIKLNGTEKSVESGILDEVRVTAQIRTNTVIIQAPPSSMDLFTALIGELDLPPAIVAQVKVFQLKNSDATNMQLTLSQLFDVEVTTGGLGGIGGGGANTQFQRPVAVGPGDAPPISIRIGIDARTNSLIVSGSESGLEAVETIIRLLDSDETRARQNTAYRLRFASAIDVAAAVSDFFTQKRTIESQTQTAQQQDLIGAFQRLEQEVVVVAETTTNTLLISASPRFYDEVMILIEQLDRIQQQVIIQVVIARLTLDDDFEFGIEWGLQDSLLFDRGSVNNTTTPATLSPGFNFNSSQFPNSTAFRPENVAGQVLSNFSLGRAGANGFGGLVLAASSESVSALIRALQVDGRLEVVSRPQIMALDGRAAQVVVGEQIPYQSVTDTGNIGTEFLDVGVVLQVTPTVNPDDSVILQVLPQVSELIEFIDIGTIIANNGVTQVISAPRIRTTFTDTVVSVDNGQTVVLGGLIQDEERSNVRSIPWLGQLPYLGKLFRYTQHTRDRSELLIVMTPHIINNQSDANYHKDIEVGRMNWMLNKTAEVHGDIGVGTTVEHGSIMSSTEGEVTDGVILNPATGDGTSKLGVPSAPPPGASAPATPQLP